jgi:MHS family proline/betaine transporter-like MFS transporter
MTVNVTSYMLTGYLPTYFMPMVAGVIGLVTLVFTPEVAGRRLPGSGPSVANEARALAESEHVD